MTLARVHSCVMKVLQEEQTLKQPAKFDGDELRSDFNN
jgi:hypothetical protein